jgi:pyrimidine-nucleoside phosphorylase
MAVFLNGLNEDELAAWTDAMLHSGKVMDHSDIDGIKVDKHSTGGVGDKISICLAPAVACNAVWVPMISGRGLGHTGGTLDKLESIPGFDVNLSPEKSKSILKKSGMFLIGQTEDLAPADRKMYALRDVTGTVESVALIASSIMSKKLAEGIDGLVLDVKFGKGAFMSTPKEALKLARTLVSIGKKAKKETTALLTDMNQPIGYAVGNALEIKEAIDVLKGAGPSDTRELTLALGAQMLVTGGVANSEKEGAQKIDRALKSGAALEKFAEVIELQGGDPRVCFRDDILPAASCKSYIKASESGYVAGIDPEKVAYGALFAGAGRTKKEDPVDPATGVVLKVRCGQYVSKGEILAVLHHNNKGESEAVNILLEAFSVTDEKPEIHSLIKDAIF